MFIIPWMILRIINKSMSCWTRVDKTTLLLELPTGGTVIVSQLVSECNSMNQLHVCTKIELVFNRELR